MAARRKVARRPATRPVTIINGAKAFGSTPQAGRIPSRQKFEFVWNIRTPSGDPVNGCSVVATLHSPSGEAVPEFQNKSLRLTAPGRYVAEIGNNGTVFDAPASAYYVVKVEAMRHGEFFARWSQQVRVSVLKKSRNGRTRAAAG